MIQKKGIFSATVFLSVLVLFTSACGTGGSGPTQPNTPAANQQNTGSTGNPLNDSSGISNVQITDGVAGVVTNNLSGVSVNGETNSQPIDPSAATTIAAGSEFSSETVGIRIRMPNSITGSFDTRSGTLVFGNTGNSLGGFVFGGSAGGVQAGNSRAIRTLLPQLGLEIGQVFLDTVNPDGSTTSQFTAVNGAGGQVFMQLDVRQGNLGNYVAVLGNSTMNEQSVLSALVSEMAGSIVFNSPSSSNAIVNMGGIVLEANSSSTNLLASGSSTTGGDESFLITCTDSRYRFSASSIFVLNFGGGDTGSTNQSIEHEGRFASQLDFSGNQLISLHSNDQGTFVFNVTLNNGAVFLDQTAYTQTGTSEQQCG